MLKSVMTLASLFVFVFALTVNMASAQGNVHQVTIVEVKDGKLTVADKKGNMITLPVSKTAKISLDGKTSKLEDLKKDQPAAVTAEKVGEEKQITSIEAKTK